MKVFVYKGKRYVRIFPSPRIYNSQTVREVTNRGDIFAMNIDNQHFTVIPGRGYTQAQEMNVVKQRNSEPVRQLKLFL